MMGYKDLGFSKVDIDRSQLKGFPEIVYGKHKLAEHILAISQSLLDANNKLLITTLDTEKYQVLKREIPHLNYDPLNQIAYVNQCQPMSLGRVLIMSAGTADYRVAQEAVQTAKWLGCQVDELNDVGVASLGRLLEHVTMIRTASVVIVIAGMEGALPSVVAGLVDTPVIAVPTSVGYGTNLEGLTTVLAMLTSCSSGISVVNIDNGFGAAYQAATIIKLLNKGNTP